ncbi:MAG: hypothetical protein A3A24_01840 [Candidatus Buchananbacteria bacterium RIFCSPLOWO2_01_FULL_46_12]|uniref:Uncharacterized protein n=2 Tax=Candidatus Buchananiibacteriota TaxID=1817903 RepID=A0A1G1YMZ1_9BACT|nr:MAG: hypothetical protein A2744_00440 [Candidatus Buchananbacteria bacterium RIFCSPHIGHO2_01_FULL_44_11]OGY53661.1 MAG: hypothetical protein A3A24_01840 [Candidatus Buchananbacteria bacterium RIFCSPLOWO2_01_FULL_46_12]
MRIKVFLFFIAVGSVLSLISWLITIFFIDPQNAGLAGFSVFYLSFFLTLVGLMFLVGNWLRAKFAKKQIIYYRINTALRQAIWFAILIAGWTVLRSRNLANIWIVVLFILVLTSLEFFFVSYQKKSYLRNERENSTT